MTNAEAKVFLRMIKAEAFLRRLEDLIESDIRRTDKRGYPYIHTGEMEQLIKGKLEDIAEWFYEAFKDTVPEEKKGAKQ